MAVSPASAGGRAVPARTTAYDAATGLVASISDGVSTITYGHDTLGRLTGYADGSGVTAALGYDVAGRLVRRDDGEAITSYGPRRGRPGRSLTPTLDPARPRTGGGRRKERRPAP